MNYVFFLANDPKPCNRTQFATQHDLDRAPNPKTPT